MNKNLEIYHSSKNDDIIKAPMKETVNHMRPNKCNQCNFASAQANNLRRHLKMHSGEKSHQCKQCNFASAEKANLRRHLKMHSGDKSHQCKQCNFASAEKANLRRHLKMHTGEKSNKCNQCNFRSYLAGNLKDHLKRHIALDSKIWKSKGPVFTQFCSKFQNFSFDFILFIY